LLVPKMPRVGTKSTTQKEPESHVRPQSNAWTCLVSLYQVLAFSVPCGVRAGPYCPTRPRKHLLTANSIIRPAGKPFSPFFIEISAYTPPTKKPRAHLLSGESDIKNKTGAYVLAGLTKSRVFDTGCRMTHEISNASFFPRAVISPAFRFCIQTSQARLRHP